MGKQIERWVILPDVHRPWHRKPLWNKVMKMIKEMKPSGIVITGDYLDLCTLSRHNEGSLKNLRNITLTQEYNDGRKGLDEIDSVIPKGCKKVYIYGNHEDNYFRELERGDKAKYGESLRSPREALLLDERKYIVKENWKDDYYTLGKHLDVLHGLFISEHTAKKHLEMTLHSCIFGHCFDDKTEILTPEGWKKGIDLDENSLVATMNKQTRKIEFQKPSAKHVYDSYKELYEFNTVSTSLSVTDGHGLIYLDEDGALIEKSAKDYAAQSKVGQFMNAIGNTFTPVDFSNDELRMLVWILADGSVEQRSGPRLRFHLKKQRKITRLCKLLDKLDIVYSCRVQTSGKTKININKHSADRFIEILSGGKVMPDWFSFLPKEQAMVIYEEYKVTDGSRTNGSSFQISSFKDRELNILQTMLVTNGIRVNKGSHWLSACDIKSTGGVNPKTAKIVPYSGKVWCYSVDNGTLLVRRNGKVVVTQNSHRIQSHRHGDKAAYNIGALCDIWHERFNYMPRLSKLKWANGFAIVTIDSNGLFYVEQVSVYDDKFWANGKLY